MPDEGVFQWGHQFIAQNPQFTEISDRNMIAWLASSGLDKGAIGNLFWAELVFSWKVVWAILVKCLKGFHIYRRIEIFFAWSIWIFLYTSNLWYWCFSEFLSAAGGLRNLWFRLSSFGSLIRFYILKQTLSASQTRSITINPKQNWGIAKPLTQSQSNLDVFIKRIHRLQPDDSRFQP